MNKHFILNGIGYEIGVTADLAIPNYLIGGIACIDINFKAFIAMVTMYRVINHGSF